MEHDLKKQSQFAPGRMGVKLSVMEAYDYRSPAGMRENKAKQSQIKRAPSEAGAVEQVLTLPGDRLAERSA
jgi:hypothetical protein